jgi:hypothetical protein
MIDSSPVISPPDPAPMSPSDLVPYYDQTTRYAAAAAHINPWLCASILTNFFGRPYAAWGPSIGVDPVAVLRHAVEARRRRRIRDAVLIIVLVAAVATVLVRLAARHGLRPTMVTFVVLAAIAVVGRLMRGPLRRTAAKAWSGLRGKPTRMIAAGSSAVLMVVVVGTTVIRWPGLMVDLVVMTGALIASWATLIVSAYLSLRRAAIVRDTAGRTADLARPLKAALEDRLRELTTANVVVYGAGRAELPFLGSGQRIRTWKFEIDVKRGAPGPAGARLEPLPFTDLDLNRYLDRSFLAEQTETMTCTHRLYIDGRSGQLVDSTAAGSHPVQFVPSEALLGEIERTGNDNYRRVYFCLQEVARDGEVVVSVFVRPRLRGRLLYIELAMHALFSLDPVIVGQVRRLSNHRVDRAQAALGRGTRRLPRMIFGAFRRSWLDIREVWRRARRRRLARRAMRRERPFDFGANITLREGISTDEVEDLHFNAVMDVVSIGAALQNQLLNTLQEFLEHHRIDTADFTETKQQIVTTIQTWNVGQVKAEMVGFGNNNDFTNNESPSPASPPQPDRQAKEAKP